MTSPFTTARAMHAAEMRGQDMQDAPDRIWAWDYWEGNAPRAGDWVDEMGEAPPEAEKYTLSDLCPTQADLDAAVQAAEQRALDSVTTLHTVVSRIRESSGVGSAPMLAELPDAIAARIEAAALAEREACARLADIAAKTLEKDAPMISRDTGVNQMFFHLAAAIRARWQK